MMCGTFRISFQNKKGWSGNVEQFKARSLAKGRTHMKGLIFMIPFHQSLVKTHSEIFLALDAHFDLKLHQMNVMTTFFERPAF